MRRLIRQLRVKDLLWVAYGLVLLIYGAARGPVTSDEALHWIIRRSYSFAFFHFPIEVIRNGFDIASTVLLQSLEGAGAVALYGKPFFYVLTVPLSLVSLDYWTLILPSVVLLTAFFAYGIRRLTRPLAIYTWCVLFLVPPLMWLFGPSATGNVISGVLLVFAIIVLESQSIRLQWRWGICGLLISCAVLTHYSIIPALIFFLPFIFVVRRRELTLRILPYFAGGLMGPIMLAVAATFALQLVFDRVLEPGAFLNYAQELIRQFNGVNGSNGTDAWFYPRVLVEVGGFNMMLLVAGILAYCSSGNFLRDFRFQAGLYLFVVGVITISLSLTRAGRTLLDFLPALFLAFLVLLEDFSSRLREMGHRARFWSRIALVSLSLVLLLFCGARLLDVLTYKDLGRSLQENIEEMHSEYGVNPYIEGYFYHFLRYAYLSRATREELSPGWRGSALISIHEADINFPRGVAFIERCEKELGGKIEVGDWHAFSYFNWVDDKNFGKATSTPFALCLRPVSESI